MRLLFLFCLMVNLMALEFPSIIADGMILQRDSQVPIWGWDISGNEVTVHFRDQQATTRVDQLGRWQLSIASGAAGGPFSLRIVGSEERLLEDVLVGEVWIAGGQSNMWWPLRNCKGGDAVIATHQDRQLRCYYPGAIWADEEQFQHDGARWQYAVTDELQDWPGLPFFFAEDLRQELDVPVGIIHLAVPGKQIETFMAPDLLQRQFPQVLRYYEAAQDSDWMAAHERAVQFWEDSCMVGEKPQKPYMPQQPAGLWNGTVAPCAPYAARGFIWWQGEANAGQPWLYQALFPALISDWRERFQVPPHAAFYYGELHGAWEQPTPDLTEAPWPRFREAQAVATRLPQVHPINANDLQDPEEKNWPNQIHPWDKAAAAERMSRRALVEVYGQDAVAWACPRISGYHLDSDRVILEVAHVGDGLAVRDGASATAFLLAGADRQWHPATAELQGDRIILHSDAVEQPIAARHAWANYPQVNVVNSIGLPLATWRSDGW